MKISVYSAIMLCSALLASPVMAIEPIPGSITYNGQPATRLQKAPIGSQLTHEFYSGTGRYSETYIIQSDRSLKLVSRVQRSNN